MLERAAPPRPEGPPQRAGGRHVAHRRAGFSCFVPHAAALLGLVTLGACTEPPAYEVRWNLVGEAGLAAGSIPDFDAVDELVSVKQCADVGITRVRVTTLRASGSILDVQEYPCFPRVFSVGGGVEVPALPEGEYTVEVEALRRTGEPWTCEDDPDTEEVELCIGFAEASVTVAEGSLPVVEVVLLHPPECDDGIDNDRDGRVDGKDPACLLDPSGPESAEGSVTLFQLSVGFLDNPAVRPANVGVDGFELTVDGELLLEVAANELDTNQWPFRLPLISERFDPGTHQFSIVALGDGVARTDPFELEFNVSEESAGFVFEDFAFLDTTFLEPIVEPFGVSAGLRLDPSDETGPPCDLGGRIGGAQVQIETTRWRVTDADGQPVDAATLGLTGSTLAGSLVASDEADGWVSFACPLSVVLSSPLAWGNYSVEVAARIGATDCFVSDGPFGLAPIGDGSAQSLVLDRVVDDQGEPPAGCEECQVDSDCSGQVCEAGICKDKLP